MYLDAQLLGTVARLGHQHVQQGLSNAGVFGIQPISNSGHMEVNHTNGQLTGNVLLHLFVLVNVQLVYNKRGKKRLYEKRRGYTRREEVTRRRQTVIRVGKQLYEKRSGYKRRVTREGTSRQWGVRGEKRF